MELVEGPTLADRIAQGPIPIDEALPIARQIARRARSGARAGHHPSRSEAREHQAAADGTVKVLDFGLAKAFEPARLGRRDLSKSPTIASRRATLAGVILGTAAYMSPEQARGKAVDKRTDIWAFGCVLFEMLTGRTAVRWRDADGHRRRDCQERARLAGAATRNAGSRSVSHREVPQERPFTAASRHRRRAVPD